jgi:hypothetical protein
MLYMIMIKYLPEESITSRFLQVGSTAIQMLMTELAKLQLCTFFNLMIYSVHSLI